MTVKAVLEQGITFISVEDQMPRQVSLDMHVQDVLSLLGNPNKQHAAKSPTAQNPRYFLNYL